MSARKIKSQDIAKILEQINNDPVVLPHILEKAYLLHFDPGNIRPKPLQTVPFEVWIPIDPNYEVFPVLYSQKHGTNTLEILLNELGRIAAYDEFFIKEDGEPAILVAGLDFRGVPQTT
ncbi:hypothetical protein SAMN04487996_10417 [Dyadobacter soli]|uniref:Uncharacterized protein n=1 Tax=Dyadobacter soli TaxID=659014 RepID=A0A1G7B170_9BACT|nr:hypothetical protein [Dyadobacter soli]SDE19995.1 hypothetical protein SAMN04487996_10417 [Dyadobacter soli]